MVILILILNLTGNENPGWTIWSSIESPWSQRREAKAIVKNVTVQPIKPVYVTLVFAWNSLAGILLLPQLQLLVCCIILPAVDLSAFLCNTVTS